MMDIDDIQALHRLANRAVASGQAALLQYDALVIGQEVTVYSRHRTVISPEF